MSFSVDVLAKIAIELQTGIGHQDRFQRLISTLRHVLECDASALLRYEGRQFIPLAIDGLAKDVLGRRFTLEGHPRLETIARAGDVVRFPADSDLPDPYDGLIPGQESLKVHACIGLPLFAGQHLIGALTLDGMSPDQFDTFSDEELRLIAALAAGALNNALLIEQLESQNISPGSPAAFEQVTHTEMIGLSPGMAQLKKEIEIVAASDLNVLIFGETGTGKELVAKSIHEASPRAVNPLVYLNCAALPESVAESELFGHVKGAFTGAISNRSGKFEMADNGTLFLDEIGELSLSLQAKLLRVLQYGDIQRVGDDRSHRVDVRVLAATNRDLREAVLAGQFALPVAAGLDRRPHGAIGRLVAVVRPQHAHVAADRLGGGEIAGPDRGGQSVGAVVHQRDRLEVLAAAVDIRNPFAGRTTVVAVQHRSDRIDAQSVDAIVFDPEQRVADEVVEHLAPAEVVDQRAPILMHAFARVGVFV